MDLTYREAEARDFDTCRELMQDRLAYSQDALAALPDIWRRWLDHGSLNSAVLEYRDGLSNLHVIQFGMSVFVTDEFLVDARTAEKPHLGLHLIDLVLSGRSPVLDLAAIRAANSGTGLSLIVLHFGFSSEGWNPEQFLQIVNRIPESFFWLHYGYNIKEILIEFSTPPMVQFCLGSGFLPRSDYQAFYRDHGLVLPPADQHPHLMGLTREEAAVNPGANIARLFPFQRPRFFFRHGEQKVLLLASLGRNDEEIAVLLDVALSTVKKRWTAMYERVSGQLLEMFPDGNFAPGLSLQKRGQEKRRHLLAHLRQHPEELRPYSPLAG